MLGIFIELGAYLYLTTIHTGTIYMLLSLSSGNKIVKYFYLPNGAIMSSGFVSVPVIDSSYIGR